MLCFKPWFFRTFEKAKKRISERIRLQFERALFSGNPSLEETIREDAQLRSKAFSIYARLTSLHFFPSSKESLKILDIVFEDIRAIPEPGARRAEIFRTFGFNSWSSIYTTTLADPMIRERFVTEFCRTILDEYGLDTGTQAYEKRVRKELDRLSHHRQLQWETAVMLADLIEAQPRLAYAIQDDIEERSQEFTFLQSFAIKGFEQILSLVGKTPERRAQFIDFLLAPSTLSSRDIFLSNMQQWAEEDYSRLEDTFRTYSRRDELEAGALLHDMRETFWRQSSEVRAGIVKHALLPAKEYTHDPITVYQEAQRIVMDRVLPIAPFTERERMACDLMEETIDAYLKVIHESERGFILGGFLSAAEQLHTGDAYTSIGKMLRTFSENVGSAPYKITQGLHSYEKTPQAIRSEIVSLKYRGGKTPRWTILRQAESVLPDEEKRTIRRYGPTAGDAAYYIVLFVETKTHELDAIAFLKPYAAERSAKGFQDAGATVKELVQRRPNQMRVVEKELLGIIRNAQVMGQIESNPQLALPQYHAAWMQYHQTAITVDHYTFIFDVAAWKSIGYGFRRMQGIQGRFFVDLPETTPEEISYKSAVAIAIGLIENCNALCGGKIDYDRHEYQYLITEDHRIIAFDHCGMSLTVPNESDKNELGLFLSAYIKELLINTDCSPENSIDLVLKTETDSLYVSQVRALLLAQSFTSRYTHPRISEIIEAAFRAGEIDSTVLEAIVNHLASTGSNVTIEQEIEKAPGSSKSRISIVRGYRRKGVRMKPKPVKSYLT